MSLPRLRDKVRCRMVLTKASGIMSHRDLPSRMLLSLAGEHFPRLALHLSLIRLCKDHKASVSMACLIVLSNGTRIDLIQAAKQQREA